MEWDATIKSLATALGLGLLIGVVRERRHEAGIPAAGTRTHALLCLLGAITWNLGPAAFVVALAAVGALAVASYLRTAQDDPGITGEVAVIVTLVLGGLAYENAKLAVALGVLIAVLLQAKQPLRRFSRELISERELHDALLLAAAALVIMPLLPATPIDPWGVLYPATLWRIVVLVMAVGMLGHIAVRAVGVSWGLPVAGFFSGFASSTAAVAGLGARARAQPVLTVPAAAAALLANLASLSLMTAIVGAASPSLLNSMLWPLAAAAAGLLLVAVAGLRRRAEVTEPDRDPSAGAFKLSHALFLAGFIAVVLLIAAAVREFFGEVGVLVTAVLVALAELHAAAASIAQLDAGGGLEGTTSSWGIVAILAASAVSKSVVAFSSGGRRFGAMVGSGLLLMVCGAGLTNFALLA